jgi:hypothetical protein
LAACTKRYMMGAFSASTAAAPSSFPRVTHHPRTRAPRILAGTA